MFGHLPRLRRAGKGEFTRPDRLSRGLAAWFFQQIIQCVADVSLASSPNDAIKLLRIKRIEMDTAGASLQRDACDVWRALPLLRSGALSH